MNTTQIVCCLVVLLSACCRESAPSIGSPSTDAWTRFLPAEDHAGFEELPQEEFSLVPEAKQGEALALLAESHSVVLSLEEARQFGTEGLESPRSHATVVLLRALESDDDESGMTDEDKLKVLWRSGTVVVRHMASRTRHVPKTRRAVIALLPSEPEEVFTSAIYAIHGGLKGE